MREEADRNPELTRSPMENIRLLDQICSLQGFHEGGAREVMLQEMSTLQDQLLEALDGKIEVDQGLVPQALEPKLTAAARGNEFLRLEDENHRSEVEELRSNFSSSLKRSSSMGRQVDEHQELVEKLRVLKNTWRKLERMTGEKEVVADLTIEVAIFQSALEA